MMKIERKNAVEPLRELRRALKHLPGKPSAKQVHTLRTQTRRIEALVEALTPEKKKKAHRLLQSVTPMRKAAGEVRDMDVLASKALALSAKRRDAALNRLVKHLSEMRTDGVRELRGALATHRKDARESLKNYSKLVEKQFEGRDAVESAAPAPRALANELCRWPHLDSVNIHPFRIKIKQLHYMLQLSSDTDRRLLAALNRVKDDVGDWHDWQELATVARKVLDAEDDTAALKRIDSIGDRKLKQALATANTVRERYFNNGQRTVNGTSERAKRDDGKG
jgi:CHAD domain-containing protein